MKRLYKYAILAFAIITFSSCAKDDLSNIDEPEEESAQLITASFSKNEGTKTTLSSDGLKPVWSEGDKIKIYNSDGAKSKEITLSKTEGPSSDYGKLSEDCSSFTFKKPTEFGADNIMHALYPSSCAKGISSSELLFSIPTSTKGTFAEANICGAKLDLSKSTSMSFKNLTSIIKINDKTSSITKMTITANAAIDGYDKMISGCYKVTDFSTTNATVVYSAEGTDLITITPENNVGPYYAAVAPVSVSGQIGSYYRGTSVVGGKTLSSSKQFLVNKIYNIGFANPTGTIGMFSVSSGTKVGFAPGNLQAVYSASTSSYSWQFAANQWTYIGNAAGNTTIGTSQTDKAVVDLFGWSTDGIGAGTGYKVWGINTSADNADYSGSFVDWGGALPSSYGTWRTLSKDEWTYLLNTSGSSSGRSSSSRFAKAQVNGVKGLIIFPDSYSGTIPGTGIATVNSTSESYPTSSIPSATWTSMEAAGCVFLLAAGYRDGSGVGDAGFDGYYWSSTPGDSNSAYVLNFGSGSVYPAGILNRYLGRSVRLVQE